MSVSVPPSLTAMPRAGLTARRQAALPLIGTRIASPIRDRRLRGCPRPDEALLVAVRRGQTHQIDAGRGAGAVHDTKEKRANN